MRHLEATSRPAEKICEIEGRLRRCYGRPRLENPADPLEDLVFIVLSRMTQEVKYTRTYRSLRLRFPSWEAVCDAPDDDLEEVLHDAGLAATKGRQIQSILREIKKREGDLSLCRLHSLDDEAVERYLTSLPGVGTKTARCVMLYTLNRDQCPVDTHVWRVARRLGIGPDRAWSDGQGRELGDAIPKEIRGSVHVTFIAHGREICTARRPRCGQCILDDLCPRRGVIDPARHSAWGLGT